ncbi:MAG: T9SS type A sorting domain-containing protein [Flavobacteriales bacterium]
MKKSFTIFSMFLSTIVYSQTVAIMNFNDVRAKVFSNGTLFDGMYEVPSTFPNNGVHSIYTSCLWVGGLDTNNQLHLAAELFGGSNKDYFFGPVATNYSSPTYSTKYNKVWGASNMLNNYHINSYTTPGYVVPQAIANWPGNGDVANGETAVLAPYIDSNNNGTYDPINGDYPCIRGDSALFFMVNDDKLAHSGSGGTKLGIEVHGMIYCYATNDAINQIIFGHFNIYNRSANNYNSVYLGMFADMDLGYYLDDYVGCDSLLNLYYTYNADNNDENGYGLKPPAQGLAFLNHTASKCISFNGGTSYNGLPSTPTHFYQYLKGIWKDGTPLTKGGTGYGGSIPANFMFSGRPENSSGWTAVGFAMTPEDTKGVISTGPFYFPAGGKLTLDVAFPYGRDLNGNNQTSVGVLRTNTQLAKNLYNLENFCSTVTGIETTKPNHKSPLIYPNPSNGKFYINYENNINRLQVYDIVGHEILMIKNPSTNEINLSKSNKGIYFVKLHTEEGTFTNKIVVE